MAGPYTEDQRAEILAESFVRMARDVTDIGRREVSEPESTPTPEEIRQLAFQRSPGDWRRHGREFDEWKARKIAEREVETMKQLEARLDAKIAAECDRVLNSVAKWVARDISGPYEEKLAAMQERIDSMKGRDGVGVTAVAFNHKGELLLTLSDGTVLNPPGRIVASRDEVEPIDVPPVLRRVR